MKLFQIFPLSATFSLCTKLKRLIQMIANQICQMGILPDNTNFFRKGFCSGMDN